jgi:opacity protein-like surface antigen
MFTKRHISSAATISLLLGASLFGPPATADALLGTNVRPYFSAGPSYSTGFADVESGFGVAFGFEAEQSPRFSALFRVEWNRMRTRPYLEPFNYYPHRDDLTAATWSLGARAYLGTRGRFRPYVDGGVGVRLVDDSPGGGGSGVFPLTPAPAVSEVASRDGLAVNLRLGISSAPPGRPGFFLDSGVDLVIDNLDRYGLVPVRLGVVFP